MAAQKMYSAKRKRIRVMVDAVFNHCGRKFAPWMSVQEHGKDSPYADWFMVNDWVDLKKQRDTRDGRFYSFAFVDRMPKLTRTARRSSGISAASASGGFGSLTLTASVLTWEMRCRTNF